MKRVSILFAVLLLLFPMTGLAHEALDWLDDVKIYVTGPGGELPIDAPFACIRMMTDDGERYAYFALDEKSLETFANDKKMLSDELIKTCDTFGISYTTGNKDENGNYVYDESAPESLMRFAERKCGYRPATQRARTDKIIIAHLRVQGGERKIDIAQTVTDKDRLAELQKAFRGAKYSYPGACPYMGVLTLVYEDGTAERMYKAIDSCASVLAGSFTPIDLGKDGNERFWGVFDEVWAELWD